MKLVRFGEFGDERPGVWLEESGKAMILDVRATAFDIEDYNEHFFSHYGLERLENLLKERNRKMIPAEGIRLGAPIARPGKIICLGKNYAEHAKEFDAKVPSSPILFSKAATAMIGPNDNVILPSNCKTIDGELELAVVIGKQARKVSADKAFDYVAGYTILNDVTDREAQRSGQQWFRGKSADTFCPVGPWLVTKDEIKDPHNLKLKFIHNGAVLQDDSTANMIFNIPFVISFISASIALLPGDVIATGTPAGIGSLRNPPVVFCPGDQIELTIEGLGRQSNKIVVAE
ncbi:MAG: fumarylacetoacetate hydrolase family protein [Kiritimatiellia bacterium]|nr:fumarylacetoacetate hydrolase family protein [Kiritimatiellia bacterium]